MVRQSSWIFRSEILTTVTTGIKVAKDRTATEPQSVVCLSFSFFFFFALWCVYSLKTVQSVKMIASPKARVL